MTGKIRFLHIPKTAGSSFDDCLFIVYLRAYLLRQRFTFTGNFPADQNRYRALSARQRRRIVICIGHAPRLTGIADIDALPTVTILRNPIERVKSFCQHVSEGKSPLIGPGSAPGGFDLDEFLTSGRTQLDNFQSRMLLGEKGYELPPGDTETLARRALQILEADFASFGLTEEFDRTLLLFRQALGWRKMPLYRSRNRRNPQAIIGFEQRHTERIRQLNQIDLRLYELARGLFYRRLAERCPDLDEQLLQLQSGLGKPLPVFRAMDTARAIRRGSRRLIGR